MDEHRHRAALCPCRRPPQKNQKSKPRVNRCLECDLVCSKCEEGDTALDEHGHNASMCPCRRPPQKRPHRGKREADGDEEDLEEDKALVLRSPGGSG